MQNLSLTRFGQYPKNIMPLSCRIYLELVLDINLNNMSSFSDFLEHLSSKNFSLGVASGDY